MFDLLKIYLLYEYLDGDVSARNSPAAVSPRNSGLPPDRTGARRGNTSPGSETSESERRKINFTFHLFQNSFRFLYSENGDYNGEKKTFFSVSYANWPLNVPV